MNIFSITEALKFGLKNTIDYLLLILGLFGVAFLAHVCTIIAIIIGFLGTAVGTYLGERFYIVQQDHTTLFSVDFSSSYMIVCGLIAIIIVLLLEAWLTVGVIRLSLHVYDTGEAHYRDFFGSGHALWSLLGAKILYNLMVMVGLALFILPGIYCALCFWFYPQVVVDKGYGPLQALRSSYAMTRGMRLQVAAFAIISLLLMSIGSALFMVGLVVVLPVLVLANAYIYRKLAHHYELMHR